MPNTANGQEALVNLTMAEGLAGETVNNVMTDHNGYTWIATTGGVSIYNGRNLMTLRILNDKGRALDVFDLCETPDHTVYAATEGGLYRLATAEGRFEQVLPEVERPIGLLAVGDTVYIAGEQGLMYYDGRQLQRQDVGASRRGLDNVVRHYVRDENGLVWFLGRYDLYSYDPATGHIDRYDLVSAMGGQQALTQFDIYDGRKFFIGTRTDGLYVYEPATGELRHLDSVGKIVLTVQRSSDNLIAIATDGTGACLLDPDTEQVVERFSMESLGGSRLPTNALYCYYRDGNGINWLGTVRCGLVYNPYDSRLFRPYEPDGLSTLGMNVRSFVVRGSESVIGLQNGLWFVDSARHVRRFFSPDELGGHIVNNIEWWEGQYVIGMYDGGICLLDPATQTIRPLPSFLASLSHTTVGDISVAPDSTLWIGCTDGLFIINNDGSYQRFAEHNSHIVGGIIIDITFDCEGNAWLAGAKGLSLYSAASHDIVDTDFPEGFFNHESYMRGMAGHDGLVYMRNGPQLFYTTPKMEHFGELTLPVSLADRWCRGMVDDGRGRLWLASERGLLGIDYEGRNLVQIGEGEGLVGSNISEIALYSDSTLWVATSDGLFYTTCEALHQRSDHISHRMTLYNVRVGSDLLTSGEMSEMSEKNTIRLTWNLTSQVLQAEPLLLDYARQRGRFYEYRIDDGDWQLVDDSQPIAVRNLLLGSHQLTVRMAGVEATETMYQLKVAPSAWAWIELALLMVALLALWLWWRYRKNTKVLLTERDQIEEALIESEELRVKSEDELLSAGESGGRWLPVGEPTGMVAAGEPTQKYSKVKVDDEECADIVRRMKEYVERELVYTDADLKMKDLADVLHLSAPKLSQVFNLYLGENYYDFINRYRLSEFKRLIEAGEYKRYTITALSEQCGFKKSNFFSTFRKVEGMTPAEYLKKHGVKM